MKGHEPLIAMRLQGKVPTLVQIVCDEGLGFSRDWHLWDTSIGFPEILVEPEDSVSRLDLRFLVGLNVLVDSDDPDRMRALVARCKAEGAKRAIGFTHRRVGGGRLETIATEDSWQS